MVVTAKITSKGQITLPREVRRLLDVHAGSVVAFETEDDRIVIKTVKTLQAFKGMLKGRGKSADEDRVRETAKQYRGKRAGTRG